MTRIFDYDVPLDPWAAIPLFIAIQCALIWAVDPVFKRYLNAWAESTETVWDDVVVFLVRGVLLTAMVLSIPYVAVQAFVPDDFVAFEWIRPRPDWGPRGLTKWHLEVFLFALLVAGVAAVNFKALAMAGKLIREKSARASIWLGFARGLANFGIAVCAAMIVWDYATAKQEFTVFLGREIPVSPWLVVPILIAAQSALIGIANTVFDRYLKAWAASTETEWDDVVVWAAGKAVLTLLLLSIPFVVLNSYEFLAGKAQLYGNRAITIAAIVSLTFIAYSTISDILVKALAKKEGGQALAHPIQTVVKVFFAVIGIMIILDTLEISITPILTTLGIGSVAIALALQDTLSNLFAGFYVMADRPIRAGDYVGIGTEVEGTVEKIGWRTTRLRTRSDNVVIIPNGKLSQATITNFNLPAKPLMIRHKVGVSYDDDPRKVMAVLLDVARKAAEEVQGFQPTPAPDVVFYPGFGDSSLDLTVVIAVREYGAQFAAISELNTRIFERFAKEGIRIPYPHRTLYVRNETDWRKKE